MKYVISLMMCFLAASAFAEDYLIATGNEGGGYELMGKIIGGNIKVAADKKGLTINPVVLNTNGSVENIELLNDGKVNMAIVQSDALNLHRPSVPVKAKVGKSEYVFWLYNPKHGFETLDSLEGNTEYRIVIVEGSGAEVTLKSFSQEDSGYVPNYENAVFADSTYDAADMVAEGQDSGVKIAGMIYVGRSVPGEVAQDFHGRIKVGEATDRDFDNGKDLNGDRLYATCEIEKLAMNGIQTTTWGSPDTICLSNMVVYVPSDNRNLSRVVKRSVNRSLRVLQ